MTPLPAVGGVTRAEVATLMIRSAAIPTALRQLCGTEAYSRRDPEIGAAELGEQ